MQPIARSLLVSMAALALAVPAAAQAGSAGSTRFAVTSAFMRAYAEIVYDTAVLQMTMTLDTGGSSARLIGRRIGAEV